MAKFEPLRDQSDNQSPTNFQTVPLRVQCTYLATKYRRVGVLSIAGILWSAAFSSSPELTAGSSPVATAGTDWALHLAFASLVGSYLAVTTIIDRQLGPSYRLKALLRHFRKDREFIRHLERCLLRDEFPQCRHQKIVVSSLPTPPAPLVDFRLKPFYE